MTAPEVLDLAVDIPRLVIAGLSGDSGKTIVSLSLLAGFRQKAFSLSVFKKGPDYIDAAWLTRAAGSECHNLDTFMSPAEVVLRRFLVEASDSDLAIVEGNRGLYDGKDVDGSHSTAELAKLLQSPVVLVVDCTKTTRTVAALVKGCIDFDPDVRVIGVILNKIGGQRHQSVVRDAVEKYCGVPVLGVIPKIKQDALLIPGRHLGLIPPTEFAQESDFENGLAEVAKAHLDMDRILEAARTAPALEMTQSKKQVAAENHIKIGYFRDEVFTFYYPENLEALRQSGAELVPVSSLDSKSLPKVDGLYIGGGFPETFAERLVNNKSLLKSVKDAAESDLPIYAECGGLIYLSRSLKWRDKTYKFANVFPLDLELTARPAGHGYTQLIADRPNPFFEVGQEIRGHEFHYSGPIDGQPDDASHNCCLSVKTGVGVRNSRDGLLYKSTVACYTHIHADGVPGWSQAFVEAAHRYHKRTSRGRGAGTVTHAVGTC
jgi:cobyrinic acid a,c-diamide synthase